jgi:uroporphyrinogen-III synthase
MIALVVIRPQPGCDATVAAARAMGLDTHGYPLFEIASQSWSPPDPEDIDALLIGSANAVRHGGEGVARFRGKPVYAVGRTSAEAAGAVGLDVVATGNGGLQALLGGLLPGHRRLLRLAGEARVKLDPPEGVEIIERVVYAATPLPMPTALVDLLREPAVILLHSAEAARHFAGLCDTHDIDRTPLSLVTIGPRVAAATASGWRAVATAERPDDAALLALARQMCES